MHAHIQVQARMLFAQALKDFLVGVAAVGQHPLRRSQHFRNALQIRLQLSRVTAAIAHPLAHDLLAATGIHHSLTVVALAGTLTLALAHQPPLRIGKVDLLIGLWRELRRLGIGLLGTLG